MGLRIPDDISITASGYYNSAHGDVRSLMERIQRMFETDMPLDDEYNLHGGGNDYKISVTVTKVVS